MNSISLQSVLPIWGMSLQLFWRPSLTLVSPLFPPLLKFSFILLARNAWISGKRVKWEKEMEMRQREAQCVGVCDWFLKHSYCILLLTDKEERGGPEARCRNMPLRNFMQIDKVTVGYYVLELIWKISVEENNMLAVPRLQMGQSSIAREVNSLMHR